MKKTVKLADVLWRAANRCLWDGTGSSGRGRESFSCHAVLEAQSDGDGYWHDNSGVEYLERLGCNVFDASFQNFEPGPQRQGVRYMWLLLAMHVAEDDGIEVEVTR